MFGVARYFLVLTVLLAGGCDGVRPAELWNTSLTTLVTGVTTDVADDLSDTFFPSPSAFSADSLPEASLLPSSEIDLSGGENFGVEIRMVRPILSTGGSLTLMCAEEGDAKLTIDNVTILEGLSITGHSGQSELNNAFFPEDADGDERMPACRPADDDDEDESMNEVKLKISLTLNLSGENGASGSITIPVGGTLTVFGVAESG